MFKKSKKILKENIFLNDKYKPIKSLQFSEEIKKPFLSDMQISEILSLSNKDSGFNIQLKVFEKKVKLMPVDLIYLFVFAFLIPLSCALLAYKELFVRNNVTGIIAYTGSIGAFLISSAIFLLFSSKIYEKMTGAKNISEIKKNRANISLSEKIRDSDVILNTFNTIVNQNKNMSDSYKRKTIVDDMVGEKYSDLHVDQFTLIEKKLITAIIDDLSDEILK